VNRTNVTSGLSCLVPDAVWRRVREKSTEHRGGPGGKTPYYFQMKDQSPFAFAGLWERWERGEEPVESCTLITTEANGVVGPVHNRMPVILGCPPGKLKSVGWCLELQ